MRSLACADFSMWRYIYTYATGLLAEGKADTAADTESGAEDSAEDSTSEESSAEDDGPVCK